MPSGGTASPAVASPQLHKHVPLPLKQGGPACGHEAGRRRWEGSGGLSSCQPGPSTPKVPGQMSVKWGLVWGLSMPHSPQLAWSLTSEVPVKGRDSHLSRPGPA